MALALHLMTTRAGARAEPTAADGGAGGREAGDLGSRLILPPYRQAAIPQLLGMNPASPPLEPFGPPEFAHPFERDFAEVLTHYGVRWSYEPTAFALEWDACGEPTELMTPDFYLPGERLYVELTAMRQRLVTRKHRKIRRLRALYPNVRITLLYRRDYERLAMAYGQREATRAEAFAPPTVQLSRTDLEQRIHALAAQVAGDHFASDPADEPLLLRVGPGSDAFADGLTHALREMGVATAPTRVDVAGYRLGGARRRLRFVSDEPLRGICGRRVLLLADIVSTGLTVGSLRRWLRRCGAAEVDVCVLLDRRATRLFDIDLRYVGFEVPNDLLGGFGLTLVEEFRDLPDVAVLRRIDGATA